MSYSRNRNRRERAKRMLCQGVNGIDVSLMARRVKRAAWRSKWLPRVNTEIGRARAKADRRASR